MPSRARLAVAALVADGSPESREVCLTADEVIELCEAEDLAPLVHERLATRPAGWPAPVREAVAVKAREAAGIELLRGAETRAVVDALAAAGVRALLIKGTPLAYSVYPAPATRPREDTDLLIAAADVDAARGVLRELGYTPTVYCDRLFSQFEAQKIDRFGVTHACDVHWQISTQPVFAEVLTFGEMWPRAIPVPALGPSARTVSAVDALLLACIHPAMHHRNAERLLWLYDIHLILSRLSSPDLDEFVRQARQKRVAAICARQLARVQGVFGTRVPARIGEGLSGGAGDEPSAGYLASERRWHHEQIASVRALPRLSQRVRWLREVLLPSPAYMLGAYRLRDNPLGPWLLPALYVHRHVRGAWKILSGKK